MNSDTSKIVRIILIASALFSTTSCVSVWHFEDLESRVATLEKDSVEILEKQKKDQERLEKLHADMSEAEETLRKSGANLGEDMENLKLEATKLQSSNEEIRFNLSRQATELKAIRRALDERLGVASLDIPEGLINDPDKLLEAVNEAFKSGDDKKATELAEIATSKYPDGLVAAQAHFVLGEIAFKTGSLATAVKEYQYIHDHFKAVKGAPVNQSLLRIAEALDKQGSCKKAVAVYEYLIESAKKTPEAETGSKRLKELKKRKNCR